MSKGARPGSDRQTHRHTQNGPKTEDLYIFFILYFYFFIGGLKDTNNLTHAQGVNSQCQPILNRQKNKCMFAAIETINQYPDTPRSRFQNKPSSFQFLICVSFSLVKKTISIDVKNLKIGHWWYDNLYIFVVILEAILDFHMKYQIYTILKVFNIFIGRKSQKIDSEIKQIEQQVPELWLSKNLKIKGA